MAQAGAISWLFSLVDRVSRPAKVISKSVDTITKSTKTAEQAAGRTGSAWGKVFGGIQQAASSAARGVQGAFRGIGESFRKIVNLPNLIAGTFAAWGGKLVLDAVGWRESTLSGLDLLLGGQKRAAAVMKEIEGLSSRLRLPMDTVAAHMEGFLRTGKVTVAESEVMMRALGEVYATKGFRPEVFELGAETMRFMATQSSLTARAYTGAFRQMGLSTAVFEQNLAKLRGETVAQTKKALAAGQIAGKQGVQAMVATIQQQFSRGKPIGTALEEQSRTFPGLMRGLSVAWGNLWKKLDLSAMPGLEPFRKLLDSIIKILEDDKLRESVQRIVSDIFEALFGGVAGTIDEKSIIGFLEKLPGMAKQAGDAIRGFGAGVGDAFGVIKRAWDFVEPAFSALERLFGGGVKKAGGAGGAGRTAGFAAGIIGPLLILKPILGPIIGLFGALAAKLFLLGKAWLVGMGPIGWIILGLAGVAALVIHFQDDIQKAFQGVLDWLGNLWKGFEQWGNNLDAWVMGLAKQFKDWLAGLVTSADTWLANLEKSFNDGLANIWKAITDFGNRMWDAAIKWGTDLIGGFTKGITDKIDAVKDTLGGVWRGITRTVQNVLGEKSPSKVFERIGKNVMEGFTRGVGDTGPQVPMPSVAGNGRAAPRANLSIVINIDGSRSPQETGEAVRDSVTSVLGQWFDLFAQETGGTPEAAG